MWESEHLGPKKVSIDERHAMIVEEVNRRSSVQVADICERFGISEVTARNDLDRLEGSGKLRRTHGGAVSINRTITISYPDQRMNINVRAKQNVVACASKLVANGDSLLIDTGTTTFELVRTLYDKRDITIVTSDLSIATFADSNLPHAEVLLLGGALRKNHRYITGPITRDVLERLYLDKAFLATDSFSPDQGFTTEHTGNAEVKSLMLKRARRRFMLMDHSKLRAPRFIRFADLGDFDAIVMDCDPEHIVAQAIEQEGMRTRLMLESECAATGQASCTSDSAPTKQGDVGRQNESHIGDQM